MQGYCAVVKCFGTLRLFRFSAQPRVAVLIHDNWPTDTRHCLGTVVPHKQWIQI